MMRKYVYFIVALLLGLSADGQSNQGTIDPSVLSARTDSSQYLVGGIVNIPWNTHFQPRPFL